MGKEVDKIKESKWLLIRLYMKNKLIFIISLFFGIIIGIIMYGGFRIFDLSSETNTYLLFEFVLVWFVLGFILSLLIMLGIKIFLQKINRKT